MRDHRAKRVRWHIRLANALTGAWEWLTPFQAPHLLLLTSLSILASALILRGPEIWQSLNENDAFNLTTLSIGLALIAFGLMGIATRLYARNYVTHRRGTDAEIPLWVAVLLTLFLFFFLSGAGMLSAWFLMSGPSVDFPEKLGAGQTEKVLVRIFSLSAVLSAVVILVTTYRKQVGAEKTENREEVRHFAELFSKAVEQLSDEHPTVRLAGAQHLALLADNAPKDEYKQNCVDQLCSYLRTPHKDLAEWDGDKSSPHGEGQQKKAERIQIQAAHEVNLTIIRLIRDHCRPNAQKSNSWSDLDFDLTGAVFHGSDFSEAVFNKRAIFRNAHFISGETSFKEARFELTEEDISGGQKSSSADFSRTVFRCASSDFTNIATRNGIDFSGARFSEGDHSFDETNSDMTEEGSVDMDLSNAKFTGGRITITLSETGKTILHLDNAEITGGEFVLGGETIGDGRITARGLVLEGSGSFSCPEIREDTDGAPPPPSWLTKARRNHPNGNWELGSEQEQRRHKPDEKEVTA